MKRAKKRYPQKKFKKTDRDKPKTSYQRPSLYQSNHSTEQSFARAFEHYSEGQLFEAEHLCRQILQSDSNQPHALHLLGVIAHQMGDLNSAFELINRALTNNPSFSDAHNNLGNVLKDLNKLDEALTSFHLALKIIPNSAEVHNNIGIVLNKLNRLDEAVLSYKTALFYKPDYAEAYSNLGNVLKKQNRLEEALKSYQKAIAINPKYVEAHRNLGVTLQEMNMLEESINSHEQALMLDPENVATKFYLSLSLLGSGNYRRGLALFDYRLVYDSETVGTRYFPPPFWDGSNLKGEKILIWGEQGIGDEILYALFFSELISRGAKCFIECQPRLVSLFKRSFPSATVFPRKEKPEPELLSPDIKFQSPSGSLLQWLLTPFEKREMSEKYLLADRDQTSIFRSRYQTNNVSKIVGLGWATSVLTDGWDNIPLAAFDSILKIPGVQFVSVQYGDHTAELEASFQRTGVKIIEDIEVDPLKNMDNFASQLTSMDLVITITNSTAALACALGVPTWGISSPIVDWRFGNKSCNNLWYPSLRLFRQSNKTDWSTISRDLTKALRKFIDES